MTKNILVTGGAGFIGSNFVDYIIRKYPDYHITVLDVLTYAGNADNLPKLFFNNITEQYSFVYGNVTNSTLVESVVAESDIIVHFAAETHVTRSIYDNKAFFETDVLGTHTIANSVCKFKDKVKLLVHISTSEVYGTALTEAISEDHPLNPASPYAAAKAGADRLVYSYWNTYKIPTVIIRPFNNYGPKQHLEKLVSRFITSGILNESLKIHGDGSAARDFIFVEDTCAAIDAIMHADRSLVVGETFNVGTGTHRSVSSIATDIQDLFHNKKMDSIYIGERPGQVVRHTADISKIKNKIGWEPKVSWKDGLRSTFHWYINNRHVWEKQIWMREIPIVTATGKKEMH